MRLVFGCLFWGSLLTATLMDMKTKTVVNVIWWISLFGSIGMIWLSSADNISGYSDFGLFCGLQLFFFSRFYGRADSYAYIACAAYGLASGWNLRMFLTHMLISFLLLALVQIPRKNVDSRGNLHRPVAFVPYISIAFLFLFWYYGKR